MSDQNNFKSLDSTFLKLPSEVQVQILECLKVPSQIACMLVSHQFYELICHIRKKQTSNNPVKEQIWRRLIPMLWWRGGAGLLTEEPVSVWTNEPTGW